MSAAARLKGALALPPGDGAPIGPVDREHFEDAQTRNRRASWRAVLPAWLGVALAAIPLTAILTPIILIPFILIVDLLGGVIELPTALTGLAHRSATILPSVWHALLRGDGMELLSLAALLVVPGAVVMFAGWLRIRRFFSGALSAYLIEQTAARPPDRGHADEKRLLDIIEEIAVAAGIPSPKLFIMPQNAGNLVALGDRPERAVLLVSTGAIHRLGRSELQAAVAQQVAAVGNGDLAIVSTLFSVFAAWGFVALLIDAAFSREARADLRLIFRAMARGRSSPADDALAIAAVDRLLNGFTLEHVNRYARTLEQGLAGPWDYVAVFFAWYALTARVLLWILSLVVAGPFLARAWTHRRMLADASAVELVRQPDELAGAIKTLRHGDMVIGGGESFYFLFLDWSIEAKTRADRDDIANMMRGLLVRHRVRFSALHRLGATVAPLDIGGPSSRSRRAARWIAELQGGIFLLIFVPVSIAVTLVTLGGVLLGLEAGVQWLLAHLGHSVR